MSSTESHLLAALIVAFSDLRSFVSDIDFGGSLASVRIINFTAFLFCDSPSSETESFLLFYLHKEKETLIFTSISRMYITVFSNEYDEYTASIQIHTHTNKRL